MQSLNPKYIFAVFLLLTLAACKSEEEQYDESTEQQEVLTKEGIDSVLASFETIKFTDLDEEYLSYTDPESKFTQQLKNKTYHIVRGRDIYKFIVGKFRIASFISQDKYEDANEKNLDANKKLYWLVDKEMLYMILEFIQKLDELGYDKYGFYVRESHRHPLCNKVRGGASQSQHINGTAADLVIEDINKDGKKNQEDKTICLDILESLIGSRGGIGRYPGTRTIHIDCRGYGARWDSH